MKRTIAVLAIVCMLAGCAGMTTQQKVDTAFNLAKQIQVVATAYYEINKAAMTPDNQALFEKYLAGFQLALSTGQGIAGYCERWYEFTQGR
jgi:ABC-type uncharacterized transport system auxiliary subunit